MGENVYSRFERSVASNMNLRLYNISFNKGDKQYLYDTDNKKYLDCFSGATTAILGYNNREIINAYVETCGKLHHTCSVYTPTEEVVDLAEKLITIVPSSNKKNKVIFGLSGSDAIECAIKAARKFTKRKSVFCFNKAYHGSCGLSISATRWDSLREGLILDDNFHSFPYPIEEKDTHTIIESLKKYSNNDLPSAVIIESIQGDGGMYPADENFLKDLSQFCNENNIVLIFDEIQSGMGRTGKWWGFEHAEIIPDIVVVGKAVSGGYGVLSAAIGRAEILDSLGKGQHVFTYSASPHACAVCSTVINIIERNNHISKNDQLGLSFSRKLKSIKSPIIKDVRGKGLMIGVEIDPIKNINAGLVGLRCAEKGVYFGYYGQHNEVLRIHPPFIIDENDIDFACHVLDETLKEIYENRIPSETFDKFSKYCVGLGE